MTSHDDSAADFELSPGDGVSRSGFMEEASMLWSLAADQSRWGLAADAAETRRLAVGKRVKAILADALFRARAAKGPGS